jgi:hypothetical protein
VERIKAMNKSYAEDCHHNQEAKPNPSGVVVERKKADPDVANDWLRRIKESLKEK